MADARPGAFQKRFCRIGPLPLLGVAELGAEHQDSCFSCLVVGKGVSSSGDPILLPDIYGGPQNELPPLAGDTPRRSSRGGRLPPGVHAPPCYPGQRHHHWELVREAVLRPHPRPTGLKTLGVEPVMTREAFLLVQIMRKWLVA